MTDTNKLLKTILSEKAKEVENISLEVFTPNLLLTQLRHINIGLQHSQFGEIIEKHLSKASKGFDEHLKAYLIYNLAVRDFTFSTDAEFMEFVKTRIAKVQFEEDVHWNELYVDYISPENKGIMVGCYSTKASFVYEEQEGTNVMKIEFGK